MKLLFQKQRRRSLPGSSTGSSAVVGVTVDEENIIPKQQQQHQQQNDALPEQRRESRRDRQRNGFFGRRRSNSLASERSDRDLVPLSAPRPHRRTHSMGAMDSVLAYNVDVAAHPMHHHQPHYHQHLHPPHPSSAGAQMPAKSSLKKANKPYSINDAAQSSTLRAVNHEALKQASDQAFSDNLWESPMSLSHYGSGRSDGQVRVPLRAQQQKGKVVGRYGQTVHYLNGSGRSQSRAPLGQPQVVPQQQKQQNQQLKQLESSARTQRTAASTPTDSTVSSNQGARAPLQPRPTVSADAQSVSSRQSVSSQTRRPMPPTDVSMRHHAPVPVRHASIMGMAPQNHPRYLPPYPSNDFRRHPSYHQQTQQPRTAMKQQTRTELQYVPRQQPQAYPQQHHPYPVRRQYSQPSMLKSAMKKTPNPPTRSALKKPGSYAANRQPTIRPLPPLQSHEHPPIPGQVGSVPRGYSTLQPRPQQQGPPPQQHPTNYPRPSPPRKLAPPQATPAAVPTAPTRQPTPPQFGGGVPSIATVASSKLGLASSTHVSMPHQPSLKSVLSAKSFSLTDERPAETERVRQLSSSSDDNSVPSVQRSVRSARSAGHFDQPPPVAVIAKPSVSMSRPRGRSVSPKHNRHHLQRHLSVSSLPPNLNRQHQPTALRREGSNTSLVHQSMMNKFLNHAVVNSKSTTTTVTTSQTSSPESDAVNSTSPFRGTGGGSGDESHGSGGTNTARDAGSVHSVPNTFRYSSSAVAADGTKARSSLPKQFAQENSLDPYGDARSVATLGEKSIGSTLTVGSASARSQHRRKRNMAADFVSTEESSVVSTTSAPAKFYGQHQSSLPTPYERGDDASLAGLSVASSTAGSYTSGRFSTNQRLRMGSHNGNGTGSLSRSYDGGGDAGSVASQRSASSRPVHPAPNSWDVNPNSRMEPPDDWSIRDGGASVGTISPGSTRTSKSLVTVGATEIRLLKRSLSESLIFGTMGQPRGPNGGPKVGPLPDTNGWTEFGPEMGFNDRGETSGDDKSQLMDSSRRKDKSRKQLGALRRQLSETRRRRNPTQVLPPPPPLMDRGRRRSRSVPVSSPRTHAALDAEKMLAAKLRMLSGDAEEPTGNSRHRGYSVPPVRTNFLGDGAKKQKKEKKDKKSSKKKSKKAKKKNKSPKEQGRFSGRESSSIASSDHTTLSNPSTTRSLASTLSHPSNTRQLAYAKKAIPPHVGEKHLETLQVCP